MKLKYLAPMLESNDIEGTIEFYTTVLGFTQRGGFKNEDIITWCDLVRDDVSIMFSIAKYTHELRSNITERKFVHKR